MKRVLIVKEGEWGSLSRDTYEMFIDLYERTLSETAEVKVVETADEAERLLKEKRADAMVFISRGMEEVAERLAATYPETRVVVFTSLIPDGKHEGIISKGKVVWADKGKFNDPQLIRDVVLW